MDAIFLQILNGLDKGGAYALIALGLTLAFGTLGVVNFAHGALFMLGAFCAVSFNKILNFEQIVLDPVNKTAWGTPVEIKTKYIESWLGDFGAFLIDYSVPVSVLYTIPIMLLIGIIMERGLIRHFYARPHADQILVTFGLAIVLQEIVKHYFGANLIPQSAPDIVSGSADIGLWFGLGKNVVYPWWRLVYFGFSMAVIFAVFSFLQFTTFGMVVRAGMHDRHTVGLLGIDIQKKFTTIFGLAAVVAGIAGAMYTPILPPDYNIGMDFLVLSFVVVVVVVVVVGGMGSLGGAVMAGFLLGILQSFAAMKRPGNFPDFGDRSIPEHIINLWFKLLEVLPGIDQIIIYLVAVIILLTLPRGLMGRKGVMED